MTWTSLPIFLFGLLEQNIPAADLLKYPELYKINAKNNRMAFGQFFLWFLHGLWHSMAVFFGWYLFFLYGLNLNSVGKEVIMKVFLYFINVLRFSRKVCLWSLHLLHHDRCHQPQTAP